VEVDIDLKDLKAAYEINFNHINKTRGSELLEDRMKNVVDQYEELIKSKKSKFKVSRPIIVEIFKSLKNKKAPGKNGIRNELYKYKSF
jgi:hypothetical protein